MFVNEPAKGRTDVAQKSDNIATYWTSPCKVALDRAVPLTLPSFAITQHVTSLNAAKSQFLPFN